MPPFCGQCNVPSMFKTNCHMRWNLVALWMVGWRRQWRCMEVRIVDECAWWHIRFFTLKEVPLDTNTFMSGEIACTYQLCTWPLIKPLQEWKSTHSFK
jgi:hypothetical protein